MKKILKVCTLAAASICISNLSYGQHWVQPGTAPDDYIETDQSGSRPVTDVYIQNNLGVGVNHTSGSPLLPGLTLNGDINFTPPIPGNPRNIYGNVQDPNSPQTYHSYLGIHSGSSQTDGSYIKLTTPDQGVLDAGGIEYVSYDDVVGGGSAHNFMHDDGQNGPQSIMYIAKYGDIGINTTAPQSRLDINGDLRVRNGISYCRGIYSLDGNIDFTHSTTTSRSIHALSEKYLAIYANNSFSNGAGIVVSSDNNASPGMVRVVAGGAMPALGAANPDPAFDILQYDNNNYHGLFTVYKNGKVRLGQIANINTPNNYRLYVEDGILTEQLKIAAVNSINWSDYVFADDYELKSLDEVEDFINNNKHLPDVPSAEEVSENGIDVAQMDATLLRKIEELTLYVIQQQKKIEELEAKVNK